MKTAILFSAGRGLRLRPLTDTKPKALCEVNQKALIDHHLEKLNEENSTVEQVFINHAYLGDVLKRHIQSQAYNNINIHFFAEPPGGYETGGTILKLQKLTQQLDEPFMVINADIFTDYDFKTLSQPTDSLGHLVLVPKSPLHTQADFSLDEKLRVNKRNPNYLFSGIASYHPDLFKNKQGHRISVSPWLQEASSKQQLTGEIYSGVWFDIGSPERLLQASSKPLQ